MCFTHLNYFQKLLEIGYKVSQNIIKNPGESSMRSVLKQLVHNLRCLTEAFFLPTTIFDTPEIFQDLFFYLESSR